MRLHLMCTEMSLRMVRCMLDMPLYRAMFELAMKLDLFKCPGLLAVQCDLMRNLTTAPRH